jgi:DNA transformation protein
MAGFNDLLEELFEPLGGVSLRRMFGGIGVFKDGVMFGLVDDDALFLKADDTTAGTYKAEGQNPWVYEGMGKQVTMPYWRLPERLYDEPDEFREWAIAAFVVAERAKKPKARKPKAKKAAKPAKKIAAKAPKSKPKPKPKPKKKSAPKRR